MQRMQRSLAPLELYLGVETDPTFGPVLLLGHAALRVQRHGDRLPAAAAGCDPGPRHARRHAARPLPGASSPAGSARRRVWSRSLVRLSDLVVEQPRVRRLGDRPAAGQPRPRRSCSTPISSWRAPDRDPGARLAVRPYPRELEQTATLRDGRQIRLRPIRPEDAPALKQLFNEPHPGGPAAAHVLLDARAARRAGGAPEPDRLRPRDGAGGARPRQPGPVLGRRPHRRRRRQPARRILGDHPLGQAGAGAGPDLLRARSGLRQLARHRGGLGQRAGRERGHAGPGRAPGFHPPPRSRRAGHRASPRSGWPDGTGRCRTGRVPAVRRLSMPLHFAVLYGSVRSDRQGIKAARFILAPAAARAATSRRWSTRSEYRLPLLDRMYKEYPKGHAPRPLERLATLYRAVDGFVIVSGRVQPRHPAGAEEPARPLPRGVFLAPVGDRLLLGRRLRRRPGGDAAADDPGRARHAVSIPSLFPVPRVQDAFDEAGKATDPAYASGARAVPGRARMVRQGAAAGEGRRHALLTSGSATSGRSSLR